MSKKNQYRKRLDKKRGLLYFNDSEGLLESKKL